MIHANWHFKYFAHDILWYVGLDILITIISKLWHGAVFMVVTLSVVLFCHYIL